MSAKKEKKRFIFFTSARVFYKINFVLKKFHFIALPCFAGSDLVKIGNRIWGKEEEEE